MLLARQGYRVLVVDRATFPSDTVSTHIVHPLGVSALSRWGLLDRLTATGCPPIHTYTFDFGPFTIAGSPGTREAPIAYCPRRTILDKLLVDAAAESGAEVREGFTVEQVLIEDGRVVGIRGHSKQGGSIVERADVVVGADGRHSVVAEAVRPEQYDEKPPLLAGYYTYWSGLPMEGRFEQYIRENRGFAAVPTHDDLTLVIAGWPYAEFAENKKDIEGNYLKDDRARAGFRRATTRRQAGSTLSPARPCRTISANLMALVGRSWGMPATTRTSSPRKESWTPSETLNSAPPHLPSAFSGTRSFEDAMGDYHRARDAQVKAMYEFTCQLATLEPPPPEVQQLLGAIHGNQEAMDGFATAERRDDIACGVLRAGKRRCDHGSRSFKLSRQTCCGYQPPVTYCGQRESALMSSSAGYPDCCSSIRRANMSGSTLPPLMMTPTRLPSTGNAPSRTAAAPRQPVGSTTIFMRSAKNRIAATSRGVGYGQHVGDEPPDDREGVLPQMRGQRAVGDRARHRDPDDLGPSGTNAARHCRPPARRRPLAACGRQRLGGERAAGQQPAAAEADQQRVERPDLLDQFLGRRALAGDDVGMVEGRQQGQPALCSPACG